MKNFLFALLSVLLVLTVIYLIRGESGREWKIYQLRFFQEILPAAKKGADKQPPTHKAVLEPELKQIYIPELGRTDRCVSCHLGVEDPALASAEEPYRRHTEPYLRDHRPDKFGCTICHRGQGLATTLKTAHGNVRYRDEPMTPLEYMEGSCGKCHKGGETRGAPFFNAGRRLFLDWACLSCHKAQGYEMGEKVGPDLGQVKLKLKEGWLKDFLREPKSRQPGPSMPDFKLKPEEIEALSDLLERKASSEPLGGETEASLRKRIEAKTPEELKKGETIFHDSGCSTCHILESHQLQGFRKVKPIGPNLSRLSDKVRLDWLIRFLKDPKFYSPKVRMPSFNLKDEEVENLAAFLLSASKAAPMAPEHGGDGASQEASAGKAPVKGEEVFKKYSCIGCHDLKDMKEGEPGPELDGLADKPIRKLDFGDAPAGQERSLDSWLWAKVMTPRTFRNTLKMPYYYFEKEEINYIVNFLLSFSKTNIPEKYRLIAKDASLAPLKMPQDIASLFDKYRCLSCHSIRGQGGQTAPDLTGEGSRVKTDWLFNYLKNPAVLRPLLAARMPKLLLGDAEAKRLADFIDMSLIDGKVQHGFVKEEDVTEEVKMTGYMLFSRKYPCLGCHKIGDKGGTVGPELTRAGNRLRGDWIYTWIKNPQAIDPIAAMPNVGLSDDEARMIALYISSLK